MENKNQKKNFLKRLFSKKAAASVGAAVKVLTSVVLGVAMLAGTYGVVKTGVIPTTEAKVSSMYEVTDVVTTGGSVSDDIQVQYEMLDGAGQTYTAGQATPLSFRSSAPMSTFKSVEVDGATVDPSNYTVTEGSTIVTFTPEYSEALSEGEHTVAILSEGGSATTTFTAATPDPALNPSGTIPEGATYKQGSTTYTAGQAFPAKAHGDTYTYGDYSYSYSIYQENGWIVRLNTNVTDKQQTSYGVILESINDISITSMKETFRECVNLQTAPEIPNSVRNMTATFYGCKSLTTAPVIPSSVTNMASTFIICNSLTTAPEIPNSVTCMINTFGYCSSLVTAPTIPSSVTNMQSTFTNCVSLTGTIEINANPTQYNTCFFGTTNPITITGSCSITTKNNLAKTATNRNVTF